MYLLAFHENDFWQALVIFDSFGQICETIHTLYLFDTIHFAKFMVKNLIC